MRTNQKGFTLIETIMSMGILTTAIMFGMSITQNQSKDRMNKRTQALSRYLAIQATQAIMTGLAYYPPIVHSDPAKTIFYCGCFQIQGENIAAKDGSRGFKLVVIPGFDPGNPLPFDLCPDEATHEVRFYWSDIAKNEITINVQALKTKNIAPRFVSQNFKIITK